MSPGDVACIARRSSGTEIGGVYEVIAAQIDVDHAGVRGVS